MECNNLPRYLILLTWGGKTCSLSLGTIHPSILCTAYAAQHNRDPGVYPKKLKAQGRGQLNRDTRLHATDNSEM